MTNQIAPSEALCDALIAALCPDFCAEAFPGDLPVMRDLVRGAFTSLKPEPAGSGDTALVAQAVTEIESIEAKAETAAFKQWFCSAYNLKNPTDHADNGKTYAAAWRGWRARAERTNTPLTGGQEQQRLLNVIFKN